MKPLKGLKSKFGLKVAFAFIISIISIAFLGTVTYEATKASVQVTQDGKTQFIRTHANTVGELLSDLDISVQPHDQLSHKLSDPVKYGMDVTYEASKSINLAMDNEEKEYFTTASTVGGFFREEGLELKDRDELSKKESTPIKDGMSIEVNRAIQVSLNDGGKKKKVWTTASTVDELLKNQDVSLDKLDKLKPAKDKTLTADAAVTITRIEKVTDTVEKEQEYTVVTKKDSSIPKGEERVLSDGENGKITKKYEVTLKNGKETDRKLIDKTVEKKSKKRIVAIGTKVSEKPEPTQTADSPASSAVASSSSKSSSHASASKSSSNTITQTASRGESSSTKTLYMHATKYTADCSGCSGVTATGINLKANPGMKVVAVDPSVIPLGSRVWVEGYGYAVAGDTGGAINGNRIDLYVSSKGEALNYGSRSVKVKILGK